MSASNQLIGDRLGEAADLLEQQGANPFRVRAYRETAWTVGRLAEGLGEIYERAGVEGLDALPGIGPRIAAAIAELLRIGRWSQLERLRGSLDAETGAIVEIPARKAPFFRMGKELRAILNPEAVSEKAHA